MKRGQIIRKAKKEFQEMPDKYHGYKTVKINGVLHKPYKITGESCYYTTEAKVASVVASGGARTSYDYYVMEIAA
jgi:hypothetical protein